MAGAVVLDLMTTVHRDVTMEGLVRWPGVVGVARSAFCKMLCGGGELLARPLKRLVVP